MKKNRTGDMKRREARTRRVQDLGYYLVVTDTNQTEENYLIGLRDSLPAGLNGRIAIKVLRTSTADLISRCREEASKSPNYRELWIVFDRDRVPDFDKIVSDAEEAGINVGWSNPCIEIWLQAYFGKMDTPIDSVACCRNFRQTFLKNTSVEYDKADRKLYELLNRYGDEKNAIGLALKRHNQHLRNNEKIRPSQMIPCTTLYKLIDEINGKTGR